MGSALIDGSNIELENKVIGFSGSPRKKGNAEVPSKVEYSLTKKGESLRPILLALKDWGLQHVLSLGAG